jgi:hypothetical protein
MTQQEHQEWMKEFYFGLGYTRALVDSIHQDLLAEQATIRQLRRQRRLNFVNRHRRRCCAA